MLTRTAEGLAAGRHAIDLDVSGLATGVYAVRAQVRGGETRVFTHTLTVVR
ncbi:MAG: hypothetical protein AAF845_11840 [Bacteroidota bacterium]